MSQSNEIHTAEPVLNPVRQEEAKKYARVRRRLSIIDLALGGILLLLLVFGGLSQKLTGLFTLSVVPAACLYLIILMVAYAVISAPLSYYRGFVLPHRYGLSTQKLTGWLGDKAKAGALGLAFAAGVVAIIYWFIIIFPVIWWLPAWGVVVLLSLILTNLAPVLIVPLFFKMEPLGDSDLKSRLEQLAKKAQVVVRGIYLIKLSSKVTAANAALMGLGNTKRIVLGDTLMERYSPAEIEVIMAHELGHHIRNDIWRLFVTHSGAWLIGFYLADFILKVSVVPLGFSGISDIAALPLLVLILAIINLLILPLTNAYSRRLEVAADDYALRLTDNPGSFIGAMTRLTDQNLSEAQPSRWVELLIYDHPCYYKRVAHARAYAAYRGGM